jgi:surface polysaccharide O-acyltransferase-like enzyme
MVLMYHATTEPYNSAGMSVGQYSVLWWSTTVYQSLVLMGVPLFVMLSGALLLQPSKVNEPIRVFLKKRLSRIGIAFLFWSIIYFAWDYFVNHVALSVNYVIQKLLSGGAYYQFWFIYLIMGLYLITPILRILVAYADRRILRYLIALWFIAVGVIPLLHLITGFGIDENLFVLGGYIGYFIMGFYLIGVEVKSKTLWRLFLVAVVWTIIGLLLMAYPFHYLGQYYFFAYTTSANIILATVAVYMLMSKRPRDWPGNKHPRLGRLVHAVSVNTLPIFFIHVIVLETLNKGLLGFKISLMQINPIVEIPLVTVAVLFLSLALILLAKKVPVLRTLVG